ncbi:L-lactate permease [Desulfosporosinus sp. Sb-LF]|uniref:L-lactate permease n=1 Tax=Desulfosporosinus sp. Sb-LF TaxID=2560027 RepID=UPI00107F39F4|nr:L-lactate permease [Desulfosporosinus sp. Sb-LF]TGE31107.1 L-lactate permease [Desulfosporosinus sp. Sb-LF]
MKVGTLQNNPKQQKGKIALAGFALFFIITAFLPGGFFGQSIQWTQQYTPVANSLTGSALVAVLPLVIMFLSLAVFKRTSPFSCGLGLIVALILSIFVWDMPIGIASNATLYGFMLALMPILWTLTCAVWVYNMLVDSGQFEVIKKSLGYVTNDRRIQVILLIFGFGTLLEGISAFGAPIAITSAMMVGVGFPPMTAAVLCLLADTTPCAYGTQGTPLVVLQSVTGLDLNSLSSMIGRQTPITTALFACVLVCFFAGWKGFIKIWWVPLIAGLSYGVTAFIVSNTVGPFVVDIAGALSAIGITMIICRFWRPEKLWLLPNDDPDTPARFEGQKMPLSKTLRAWSPYILMIAFISIVNTSSTIKAFGVKVSTVKILWPNLHQMVSKVPPATINIEKYNAIWGPWPLLTVGGTLVFFVGLITILVTGIGFRRAAKSFKTTVVQLASAYATIMFILGISQVMNYSAMTYTMGMAFATTGFWLPMSTAILGLLGVFLTGTDAASNALFGQMVVVSADHSGHSSLLAASTLSSGGVMGKSCAPQDLAIVTASVNIPGAEGDIIRRVVWVSVVFTIIIGAIAMIQAHVFTWMIPGYTAIATVVHKTSPLVLWGFPIIVGSILVLSLYMMIRQWQDKNTFCPGGEGKVRREPLQQGNIRQD